VCVCVWGVGVCVCVGGCVCVWGGGVFVCVVCGGWGVGCVCLCCVCVWCVGGGMCVCVYVGVCVCVYINLYVQLIHTHECNFLIKQLWNVTVHFGLLCVTSLVVSWCKTANLSVCGDSTTTRRADIIFCVMLLIVLRAPYCFVRV